MNCFLYRLRFNTPVHFGSSDSALSLYESEDHFRADTLFSALCHTALQLYGNDGFGKLPDMAKTGRLLLSDAMPWAGDAYYLPKPCHAARTERELPADRRKAMKKLAWVPLDRLEEYCEAVKTGVLFECEAVSFGKAFESTKAVVPEQGDATPYPVGLFRFRENCGLYFLAALADPREQAWLTGLVEALGISGIGGKVTAGYGKFSIAQILDLNTAAPSRWKRLSALSNGESPRSLLLTTSLPRSEELESALEDADFRLVRRAGFAASEQYARTPCKKQTQYFLSAGSVVKHCFSGDLYEVGDGAAHPVYRYSKPLFLGVPL